MTTYSGQPVLFALKTTIRHQNYHLNVDGGETATYQITLF